MPACPHLKLDLEAAARRPHPSFADMSWQHHAPPEGAGRAGPHFSRLHSAWYQSSSPTMGPQYRNGNPFLTPTQLADAAATTAQLFLQRPEQQAAAASPPHPTRPAVDSGSAVLPT